MNLRLQPDTQAVVLAQRLHSPKRDHYAQSVIDLTYLRVGGYGDVKTIGEPALKEDPTGMLGWIEAFHEGNETKSLAEWRATRNTAWLLAAISFAQPSDAAAPELIRAAASIPKSSPAWMAITYHRLRLLPRDEAKRKEVLALLPEIRKSESQSTINLFTALDHATAPTLQTWLASAAREPAAESWWDDEEEAVAVTAGQEDVCGHKTTTTRLFDLDASYALNQWFPLRTLALAAESGELPENLRYQVAQAAWARAVLLDQPAIAHRMTPLLISCRAAWKPVLDTYDASKSDEDRKANGLLALMRFASVEPSVRYGEERRMGFATYDEYRQNWWCSAVPPNNDDVPGTVDQRSITPSQPLSDAPPKPLFLTPSDTAEAEAELARLRKVPSAAAYFASEALAWQKLHPGDPRAADLLGEAFRVERNSCGDKSTSELIHRVFDVLNHSYPKSAWTKRYTTWE